MWDLAVREEDFGAADSMLQRYHGVAPLSMRLLTAEAPCARGKRHRRGFGPGPRSAPPTILARLAQLGVWRPGRCGARGGRVGTASRPAGSARCPARAGKRGPGRPRVAARPAGPGA